MLDSVCRPILNKAKPKPKVVEPPKDTASTDTSNDSAKGDMKPDATNTNTNNQADAAETSTAKDDKIDMELD